VELFYENKNIGELRVASGHFKVDGREADGIRFGVLSKPDILADIRFVQFMWTEAQALKAQPKAASKWICLEVDPIKQEHTIWPIYYTTNKEEPFWNVDISRLQPKSPEYPSFTWKKDVGEWHDERWTADIPSATGIAAAQLWHKYRGDIYVAAHFHTYVLYKKTVVGLITWTSESEIRMTHSFLSVGGRYAYKNRIRFPEEIPATGKFDKSPLLQGQSDVLKTAFPFQDIVDLEH
jgi:hypothetical protein